MEKYQNDLKEMQGQQGQQRMAFAGAVAAFWAEPSPRPRCVGGLGAQGPLARNGRSQFVDTLLSI